MKKLISLLAVFTVSICAFAQEKYVVGSMEPSDNLEIQATSSIKLTLGADGGWSNKELSLMDDMTNYVTGKSNPVHTDDAGSSIGYSADNKLLPTKGTYYILDTSKDGRLAFYVQLNAVKEFFIVDGSDGTNLTKNVNIEFTQSDGTVLTATEGNKGGLTVSEKLYGSVTFDVEANKQYYVFCGGSKLGFYGLEFTEGESNGLDNITLTLADGDISTALAAAMEGKTVGDITINLQSGKTYTVSSTLVAPHSITINGGGATIDASGLTKTTINAETGESVTSPAPLIAMAERADVTDWVVANVSLSNVTISGLNYSLFTTNRVKNYAIQNFNVVDCVVEVASNFSAPLFDFRIGGVALDFTVSNSTFYAPTAFTREFYNSQSGQKATEFNANAMQTFTFANNTLYNIAYGVNFFAHRQSSQSWQAYNITNNVFVNCGKMGQLVIGFNGNVASGVPSWWVNGNAFNFDGADTSANEIASETNGKIDNCVVGLVNFIDVANGNLNATFTLGDGATAPKSLGDPRWTITYVESSQTEPENPNVLPEGIYPAKNVVWGPVTWKNANNRKDQDNNDMLFLMGTGYGYSEIYADVYWNEAQGTNVTRPYYKYINYEEGETGVPEHGLYYKFTPWMDGELKVCVWLNKGNRKTYVVKASTGEPLIPYVDYTFEGYVNGQNTNTDDSYHPTYFTADEIKARHDEQFVQDGVDTNPYVIDKGNQAIWGWITINVHSGESYVIYQQSSLIGFGGYEFNGENYQAVTGTADDPVLAPEFAAVIDENNNVLEGFLSEKGSVVSFGTGSMNVEAVSSSVVQSLEADVEDIVQLLGDVDGSGQINVTDVALIIDEILGRNPRNFNAAMADVDYNNQINVVDVVLVIDNILGKINLNRAQADAGVVGSIALSSPNTIALNNPTAYTAFQMDVTLPMGVTLKKAQLTDRSNGHLVSVSQTGEGRYRIVGISLQNEAFEGTMGDLLRLQLDGDSHGMTIENVLFATPQGVQHELAGIADATSISDVRGKMEEVRGETFNLQGQRIANPSKGLYIVNGKKAVVK